jgi:hypothetical protein
MSDENRRPRNIPWIILIPAIAVIIAAIIGGIFVLMSSPQPPTTPVFGETGGEIDTDGIYEISWTESRRATHYILQVDRDPSFTNPRTIGTTTGARQIYGQPNGDYYYRVRACNDAGESEWSPIRKITVIISTPPTTLSPTPTSAPTLTPTPTLSIIDTMDSTLGWRTYRDDRGASINIESIPGRTDNAIEISYDLKEWGWVGISKRIDPNILYEKEGIIFFYKGSGTPNTIELKLVYEDDTTFGVLWNRATVTDDWVSFEVPYSHFDCWWPDDNCLRYGHQLDLNKVRKIEFAISNKPEDGDMYGSGIVIIGDVQGITCSIPAPTPSTYLIIQKFEDTNRNALTDSSDERLQGEKFKLTDPDGKTTAYATNVMGEIIIAIPREYEGNDYTVEEIVEPGWVPELPIKQTVNVPKGKTTTVNFLNAGAAAAGLLIQKFNDANLNDKIESSDERLAGWEFKVTDPGGKITTHLTDDSGEITLEVPAEYKGKEYIVEETLLPGWEPVLPIKQTVKVLKGERITVQFLNRYQPAPESINLGMYLPDHPSPSFSLYGGSVLNVSVAWNITPAMDFKLVVNLMESETDFTRLSESDAIKIVSGSGEETFKLKVKPTTEIHDRAVISACLCNGKGQVYAYIYQYIAICPNEVTIIDYSPAPVYAGEEFNVRVGWNNILSDWNLVVSLEASETDYTRLAESDAKKTVSGSGEEIFKLKVKPTTEIHNQAKVCVALYDEKGEWLNIFEKGDIDVLPSDIPESKD